MKVLIQWTRLDPLDWIEIDSSEWSSLAKKSEPVFGRLPGDDGIDNLDGWIYGLCIQGINFTGDHYCVEDINDGSGACKITVWNDDPVDYPEGDKYAHQWTLFPLQADPNMGGAINTRQLRKIYAQQNFSAKSIHNQSLPWDQFIPPVENLVRHGIWVSDNLSERHRTATSLKGWREWIEGVPISLIKNNKVVTQRNLGLFKKAKGTRTFFNTANSHPLPSGVHVLTHEEEMALTKDDNELASSLNIAPSSQALVIVFTTVSGEPGESDWPNGEYRSQADVPTNGANINFGILTFGASAGHFARVDDGLTTDQETWTQTEAAFSGTGLFLSTRTIDPGNDVNSRWEILYAAENVNSHMAETIVFNGNTADSFADGPWAGPIIVTVNQVIETDLSQSLTVVRSRPIFQAKDFEFSNPITIKKTVIVGQNTETDLAQAITVEAGQTVAVNLVAETDLAQAITEDPKRRLVNLVTETDLAQTIGTAKAKAIGLVTETDLAQAIATTKAKAIGLVTETDLAQAFTTAKVRTIGQVTENDVSQPITLQGAQIIPVNQITETDTSQIIQVTKQRAIGQVSESNLSQSVIRIKTKAIAGVIETDLSQPITISPQRRLVNQVIELDSSLQIVVLGGIPPFVFTKTEIVFLGTTYEAKSLVTKYQVELLSGPP